MIMMQQDSHMSHGCLAPQHQYMSSATCMQGAEAQILVAAADVHVTCSAYHCRSLVYRGSLKKNYLN